MYSMKASVGLTSDFLTEILSKIVQTRDCTRLVFNRRVFVRLEDSLGVNTHTSVCNLYV